MTQIHQEGINWHVIGDLATILTSCQNKRRKKLVEKGTQKYTWMQKIRNYRNKSMWKLRPVMWLGLYQRTVLTL